MFVSLPCHEGHPRPRFSVLKVDIVLLFDQIHLLLTGSEERNVLGVGSIPVVILPSGQDMKTITL